MVQLTERERESCEQIVFIASNVHGVRISVNTRTETCRWTEHFEI